MLSLPNVLHASLNPGRGVWTVATPAGDREVRVRPVRVTYSPAAERRRNGERVLLTFARKGRG